MPKPRKNEAKQDFLGRCVAERRGGGESDADALAACAADWNSARMARLEKMREDNTALLAAEVILAEPEPGQAGDDPEARFAILAYTGKVIDWGWLGSFIIDLKGMKLAKAKVPSFYRHAHDEVVGIIDQSKMDANGFYALGQFSKITARSQEVLGLAREHFPWQASIGVMGKKLLRLEKGKTHTVNGRTVEGPIDVWLESEVFEVSFVPFGADDDTAAVALGADANLSQEESEMPKDLETKGAPNGAGGKDVEAELAAQRQAELAKEAQDAEAAKAKEAELAAAREQARKDTADLYSRGLQLGLAQAKVADVVNLGLPKDQATAKLFELAGQANPPLAQAGIEMGADERDKFRLAAQDGLLLRMGGHEIDKPAPGHEEFRGLTMADMGRRCLERMGVNTRGMTSVQVASKILALSAGPMSTSDFAAVFKDAVNKTLLKAYSEAPSTWRPFCNVVPATDFKTIYGIALSEAPDLDLTPQGGEYGTGTLKDKQESYSVRKYGVMVYVTFEMIVNDDLRAFQRLPQLLGAAARRKESDVVYGLLTGNPTMSDGHALFSSDHGNLASGDDVGAVSSTTLSAARRAMRRQKGLNNAYLEVAPKFLLVPTAMETSAEILLRSMALPEGTMSSAVHNPWANKLIPISDPRLDGDDGDETAWYVAADPNQAPTIEVAFLDGNEQPYLEETEEPKNDSLGWKVRHVFGGGVMDHPGLYKNPGE